MNNRLKELRVALNLTQTEFGERIGLSRSAVAAYEGGNATLKESIIKLICNTYNVDYFWFTEGKGEMFTDIPESVLDAICLAYDIK